MGIYSRVSEVVEMMTSVKTADALAEALRIMCSKLDFQYFALAHHVDILKAGRRAIRLHNYPQQWADYYDANALGVSDPVHRASHMKGAGFMWSEIPNLIPLTRRDRQMMIMGGEQGIGDGFTVPMNVPGEARGSCSFANEKGRPVRADRLWLAQLAGTFAFESARRIWEVTSLGIDPPPALTDRQRDCALWVGRGKGDWEIGRILNVSEETVALHIKHGCERYGVNKRTLLLIRILRDGTVTFEYLLPV